ncbi:hypothetical protein Taro_030147 [Colocasia esculenta]|uniref:Uncharacterized protein n=1 Tax=Colocasia esculenta TaxID=4460 RepID=A0A843VLQ2_COLES|nr:hypothetical protein [Colocasia esculenta]
MGFKLRLDDHNLMKMLESTTFKLHLRWEDVSSWFWASCEKTQSSWPLIRRLEASSGDLPRLEDSLNIEEHFPYFSVQRDSSQSPELEGFEGFLALDEESFSDLLFPFLIFPEARSSSVDTGSSSVDTRDLPRKPFVPIWDSVTTLDQVVSTLEAFPENI